MTPPSSTPDITDADGLDTEQVVLPPLPQPVDLRWVCWKCGDLRLLDDDGLCRSCRPDWVASWVQMSMRAVHGKSMELRRRWRIG